MSTSTVLLDYARIADPESIPISVRLSYTAKSVAIFDAYPKGIFHILILPRVIPPLSVSELANLRSLLQGNKKHAKDVILELAEHAKIVIAMVEEEMMSRYGFKWAVWTGFHAVPSLTHVHLHVISSDLCGSAMTTKRHYNTFHPKRGFLIHLDQVLEWLDAEPSFYDTMAKLDPKQYDALTKEDLVCWRCNRPIKNIPTLKDHLREEWQKEAKRSKAKQQSGAQSSRHAAGSESNAADDMEVDT